MSWLYSNEQLPSYIKFNNCQTVACHQPSYYLLNSLLKTFCWGSVLARKVLQKKLSVFPCIGE